MFVFVCDHMSVLRGGMPSMYVAAKETRKND